MGVFSVRGRVNGTIATAKGFAATLWNPDTSEQIKLLEIHCYRNALNNQRGPLIYPITTRGSSPTATTTPDADNSWDADDVPGSGVLMDHGEFGGSMPTIQEPGYLGHVSLTATGTIGGGSIFLFPDGIEIPPGRGIGLTHDAAVVWPLSEVTFVWEEDST